MSLFFPFYCYFLIWLLLFYVQVFFPFYACFFPKATEVFRYVFKRRYYPLPPVTYAPFPITVLKNCWKYEYCLAWRSFLYTIYYLPNWLMSATVPIFTYLKEIKKNLIFFFFVRQTHNIADLRIINPFHFNYLFLTVSMQWKRRNQEKTWSKGHPNGNSSEMNVENVR